MVKRYDVDGCKGNSWGAKEYTRMVSFPPEGDDEREIWIDPMPNDRQELTKKDQMDMSFSF
jgi:hypothetical protein